MAAESLTLLVSLAALFVVATFAAKVMAKIAKLLIVVVAVAWLWWVVQQNRPAICHALETKAPSALVDPLCR